MSTKVIIAVCFILFAAKVNAFGGGHDSLLFQGSNENILKIESSYLECGVKVKKVSGVVIGSKNTKEAVLRDCEGGVDTLIRTERDVPLKVGDVVALKEKITTSSDGEIEIEFYEGSIMRLAPNTVLTIEENMCATWSTILKLNAGQIWTKVKKLIGGGKFEVQSQFAPAIGVRGTEFTLEITPEKNVVKVYEGTVEVYPDVNKAVLNSQAQLELIAKDYEAGKISMQDYALKSAEYMKELREAQDAKSIMLEAGNMVSVPGRIGEPEPIPAGETKWFENMK